MRQVTLQRIEIDAAGRLLLAPAGRDSIYAHIYREANDLRWDPQKSSFVAYEPERWEHAELAGHIVKTLREAFSVCLVVTESTKWQNVVPTTEAQIREAIGVPAPTAKEDRPPNSRPWWRFWERGAK